jgi:hypothetical protein
MLEQRHRPTRNLMDLFTSRHANNHISYPPRLEEISDMQNSLKAVITAGPNLKITHCLQFLRLTPRAATSAKVATDGSRSPTMSTLLIEL